jgi:hypothetical protein
MKETLSGDEKRFNSNQELIDKKSSKISFIMEAPLKRTSFSHINN